MSDIPDPTWRDSSDFDREEWLADYIRFQLHELNLNQVVMFNGPPGSGKSWTSLSLSKKVDSTFDASRIVFPGVDFLRMIAEGGLGAGSAIAWDDAGLGAPSRKHWDPINIAAGLVSQSFRFLRLMVSINSGLSSAPGSIGILPPSPGYSSWSVPREPEPSTASTLASRPRMALAVSASSGSRNRKQVSSTPTKRRSVPTFWISTMTFSSWLGVQEETSAPRRSYFSYGTTRND